MILDPSFRDDLMDYINQEPDVSFTLAGQNKQAVLNDDDVMTRLWTVYQKNIQEYDWQASDAYADAMADILGVEIAGQTDMPEADTVQISSTADAVRHLAANSNDFTYVVCIAAAIIIDDGLQDDMTLADTNAFAQMAEDIAALACENDEPRFCLYDYLDAAVHSPNLDWHNLAREIREAFEADSNTCLADAFDRILSLAENKRASYGG